jgi:hypothetical protein
VKALLTEAATALREKAATAIAHAGKRAFDKGRASVNGAAEFVRRRMR